MAFNHLSSMMLNVRGFGFDQEDAKDAAHKVMDKVGDAASKTTQTMNSAASGDCLFNFPSVKIFAL